MVKASYPKRPKNAQLKDKPLVINTLPPVVVGHTFSKTAKGIEEMNKRYEMVQTQSNFDKFKEKILILCGEFLSTEDIRLGLVAQMGEDNFLNDSVLIERICKDSRNKYSIQQYRNKYLNKVKDIALFHKRIRLDDLQKLRDRFISQIKELDDTKEEERREFRYMAKGLTEILSVAREEIEGKGMTFNQLNLIGDFDGKSDDELISRRDELLRKAERAIGIGGPGVRGVSGADGDPAEFIEAQAEQSS